MTVSTKTTITFAITVSTIISIIISTAVAVEKRCAAETISLSIKASY